MKPALLLVDIQADYLVAEGLQPGPDFLTARAGKLLGDCRAVKIPTMTGGCRIGKKPASGNASLAPPATAPLPRCDRSKMKP
jgi:hypothetical protein